MQRKHKNNPSVSSADSSLYTREPFLASAPPSTSHENLFGADGFDCLLADAILKPSAGEFQRLADGRDRAATAGIFWRK